MGWGEGIVGKRNKFCSSFNGNSFLVLSPSFAHPHPARIHTNIENYYRISQVENLSGLSATATGIPVGGEREKPREREREIVKIVADYFLRDRYFRINLPPFTFRATISVYFLPHE